MLGIGLPLWTITVVDLGLIGVLRRPDPTETRRALVPLALAGFGIAVVSGLLFFAPSSREYLANPYFGLKLALIAVAGINALLARLWLDRSTSAP